MKIELQERSVKVSMPLVCERYPTTIIYLNFLTQVQYIQHVTQSGRHQILANVMAMGTFYAVHQYLIPSRGLSVLLYISPAFVQILKSFEINEKKITSALFFLDAICNHPAFPMKSCNDFVFAMVKRSLACFVAYSTPV